MGSVSEEDLPSADWLNQGDELRAEAGNEQPSNRQLGVKSVPRK